MIENLKSVGKIDLCPLTPFGKISQLKPVLFFEAFPNHLLGLGEERQSSDSGNSTFLFFCGIILLLNYKVRKVFHKKKHESMSFV